MKNNTPIWLLILFVMMGLAGCQNIRDFLRPNGASTQDASGVPTVANSSAAAPPRSKPQAGLTNWLHFGVDNQFSSCQPDETLITRENVSDLELIYGSGCDDGLFTVVGGTPALYQGQMILTFAGGNLEVGDAYTDTTNWSFGEPASGWAPPPVVSTDGIIYYLRVASDASSLLYAVDMKSRQKLWESAIQFETGFNFDSQVTVDEKNGQVYVIEGGFGDGRLFGVDRKTGEVAWFMGDDHQGEGATFIGTVVPLKDDRLFVTAALPLGYGKPVRSVRVDPLTQQIDMVYDRPGELDLSWDVGWYGLCDEQVVSTYQNSSARKATVLTASSVDNPGIMWQRTVPAQTGRFACDPGKKILYVPTEESLIALNAATGDLVWEHKSIDPVFTPTIANGVIYFISGSNMFALSQDDASQLFRYPLGGKADPSTGVAVNDGLVVFSGSGGDCDLYVMGLPTRSTR